MAASPIGAGFGGALLSLLFAASPALAAPTGQPFPWQLNFQPAASPVMANIEDFHRLLLYLITAISVFVLALLVFVMVRFNRRVHPAPSKTEHNTLLEVVWTVVPVIVLVIIAIPSFKLLYYEADIPKPDVTVKAIGHQWSWSYQYPGQGDFELPSNGLTTMQAANGSAPDAAKAKGEPTLLGVDNPIYVPVNRVVKVVTTSADVIHSWTIPAFGVKMDAVPGRLNETWFKATQLGTFYGQCSELCGVAHAFMPIEVKVVSDVDYNNWLASHKKTASNAAVHLAAK